MKNLLWTLGALVISVATVLLVGSLTIPQSTSQAQELIKQEKKEGKFQSKLNWEPTYYPITSSNSKLDLALPDMGVDANLIVGIQKAKKGEQQGIAVAIVEWRELENFSQGLDSKPEVISSITNYSPELITTFAGQIGLTSGVDSDKSLLVHLKVRPQTIIKLKKGNKEFTRKADDKDEIFYKGELIDVTSSEIPFLLNRLSMSKFLQNHESK